MDVDFNFDSTCSSPYMTAPSSPQRFGFTPLANPEDDHHFEFNFSGQLDQKALLSDADDLFDAGRIKPLNINNSTTTSSTSSSIIVDDYDSKNENRGRNRSDNYYVRHRTRSLSPMRISDIIIEDEEDQLDVTSATRNSKLAAILSVISFNYNKKWKLKDLLLFRSASEGHSTRKVDKFSRYEVKDSSFRATESLIGPSSVSSFRHRSAHEMHYTTNRAISEEMKRKTFLPYKQGLLGCLGFNPHEVSTRIGSMPRG
ncbi:hypothetical protein ACFE04_024425 [Oxalis oulophora]